LLVVISIIALLVSLLLPALRTARAAARTAACLSNEHQIGLLFHSYASDYEGWIPPVFNRETPGPTGDRVWGQKLQPYAGLPETAPLSEVFRCPEFPDELYKTNRGAYAMNQHVGTQSDTTGHRCPRCTAPVYNYAGVEVTSTRYFNIHLALVPSELYLASDTTGTTTSTDYAMPLNAALVPPIRRHMDRVDVLFMDGSARTLPDLVDPLARYSPGYLPWVNRDSYSSAYPRP
jgi:prepilin-type processing-associated H-X9-DG protein